MSAFAGSTGLSLGERTRRYAALRAAMADRGVDVLIAVGRDSTNARGDFRWIASYAPVTPLPHYVVFARADVEPAYRSQLPSRSKQAVATGWVNDATTHWSDLEDVLVAEVEKVYDGAKVGLARFESHSIPLYLALAKRFGGENVVDVGELFDELRLVKSAEEIELLRAAARASDLAYRELVDLVGPDTSDREIYAQARRAMHESGSEYSMDIIGCNVQGGWAPVGDCAGSDGFVQAEVTPAVGGYYNQIRFEFAFGEAASGARGRAREVLRAAYDAAVDRIRPGVGVEELYDACTEVMGAAGYGWGGGHFGHGLGLDVAEGISIEPGDSLVLAPGMTFVLHPKVVPAEGHPQLLLGGSFLVTDDGCETLNDVDLFA